MIRYYTKNEHGGILEFSDGPFQAESEVFETEERIIQGHDLLWYLESEVPKPEPPSLDEARAAKLEEINAAFARAETSGSLTSSLGFAIDATERANRDTEGLITIMEATGTASTYFCDHDNVMREVTLADVKTMRLEIIAHGQALYAKKWALRNAAEAAGSIEELDAIRWDDAGA